MALIDRNWGCGDDDHRLKQGLAQNELAAGNSGVVAAVGQTADWVQRGAGRETALGGAVAWAGVESWGCGLVTGAAVRNGTVGSATRERERERALLPRRRRKRSRLEASAQTADESGRTPSREVEPREALGLAQAKVNPSTGIQSVSNFFSLAPLWTHAAWICGTLAEVRAGAVQSGLQARLFFLLTGQG